MSYSVVGLPIVPFDGKRQYSCSVCQMIYLTEHSLAKHFQQVRNHGYVKSCAKCGKVFQTPGGYNNHMKMQHGDGNSLCCPVCHKNMHYESLLRQHMTKHTDVRPYICRYCKKDFKQYNSKLRHERSACRKKYQW